MARFGNSNGLLVKSSFLEPKCGQKSQIWPPCDQIALANWIIHMNLHFKQRKIFACGGNRATILSVSQLLSVKVANKLSHQQMRAILAIQIAQRGIIMVLLIGSPRRNPPLFCCRCKLIDLEQNWKLLKYAVILLLQFWGKVSSKLRWDEENVKI